MIVDLKKDLSTLTNVPIKYYDKMENTLQYIISDGIHESLSQGEPITEFVSDIGSLLINVEDNEIRYKFVPSEKFNEAIKSNIKYGQNLLEDKLTGILLDRITSLYKDLF